MFINGRKALDYLENNELTQKEHLRLLGILNKQLNVFPLDDVLLISDEGAICANGRILSIEEIMKFRSGIESLRENWAFQLLADQVLFEAIKHGVHFGDTTDKVMFSKSGIYFITKFYQLLKKFDRNN